MLRLPQVCWQAHPGRGYLCHCVSRGEGGRRQQGQGPVPWLGQGSSLRCVARLLQDPRRQDRALWQPLRGKAGHNTASSATLLRLPRASPFGRLGAFARSGAAPGCRHVGPPAVHAVQIVARKVYLAVPSECPVGPDGKARKAPKESVSGRTGGCGGREEGAARSIGHGWVDGGCWDVGGGGGGRHASMPC